MAGEYFLYLHINKINNKKYVGITCQNPYRRWNNGKGYKTCPYFYNGIIKYGWDNFEHIILQDGLNKETAEILEQYYINKYKSNTYLYGYNIQNGGNTRRMSESEKEIRRRTKGINNKRNKTVYKFDLEGNFIEHYYSIEYACRMNKIKNNSHISQCCNKKRKKAYGYIWSFEKHVNLPEHKRIPQSLETKNKIRDKIISNYNEKPIICIDKEITFNTRDEAINWLKKIGFYNANFESMRRCIKGKRKTYCGMNWRYING